MISKCLLFFLILGLIGSAGILNAQDTSGFKVIVNSSNPATSLTLVKVSDLFLKKIAKWDNGTKVMPVDLNDRSQVRQDFSRKVHGKTPLAVKSYWQQQLFAGTKLPPPEKAQDSEVIAYVRANPGAIGYISPDTKTEGVKLVTITQ